MDPASCTELCYRNLPKIHLKLVNLLWRQGDMPALRFVQGKCLIASHIHTKTYGVSNSRALHMQGPPWCGNKWVLHNPSVKAYAKSSMLYPTAKRGSWASVLNHCTSQLEGSNILHRILWIFPSSSSSSLSGTGPCESLMHPQDASSLLQTAALYTTLGLTTVDGGRKYQPLGLHHEQSSFAVTLGNTRHNAAL